MNLSLLLDLPGIVPLDSQPEDYKADGDKKLGARICPGKPFLVGPPQLSLLSCFGKYGQRPW